MNDYCKEILSRLLDKYETSAAYSTGIFKKRILIYPSNEFRLKDYSMAMAFKEDLDLLKKEGLVDYKYEKFEEGNLVKEIWLTEDEQKIDKAYKSLGRVNPKSITFLLCESIRGTSYREFDTFLSTLAVNMEERKKPISPFCLSERDNNDLLKAIFFLSRNEEEILERVLSIELYGDSKYFEKNVREHLLRFLSLMNNSLEKEDLLASYGVVRYPELLYFKGKGRLCFKNGSTLSLSMFPDGFYMDTRSVEALETVIVEDERILLVENKANYYESNIPSMFIFYHAGFLSPLKKKFLSLLYSSNSNKQYLHWSDIDLGGFLIHHQIRKLVPTLEPFRMDLDTLKQNREKGLTIENKDYLEKLGQLLRDESFSPFFETIRYMLDNRIRLEQESLL